MVDVSFDLVNISPWYISYKATGWIIFVSYVLSEIIRDTL